MAEVIIKSPEKKNTFTGRCSLSFEEFEAMKNLVGSGILKILFKDGMVRQCPIEQWMVDHAAPRQGSEGEYMLVTFSKHRYQNDKLNHKKFGGPK